ncbi:MAG: lytic transglycosylase domain-containing protein [Gammaproteobacteria bacterium]|nr:lytic transglycosylase domain-containing protein [Gammaproteobacteria bacterium]
MNRCGRSGIGSLLCAFLLVGSAAATDIYKYVDQDGKVYFTDQPDHTGYRRLVKTWKGWTEARIDYARIEKNRAKYTPTIRRAAELYQIPEALLHAVIRAESAYDPNATSVAGAVGMMQLMPDTARRYGVVNRQDPIANIAGGTRYLRDLLQMFDRDLTLALAAYNAGENAVLEHGRKVPPYDETRTYVRKVLSFYQASQNPVATPKSGAATKSNPG